MDSRLSSLWSGRTTALVAFVVLQFLVLQAQTPPGYVANRNTADPGPPNPAPLTAAQRLAAPIVNPQLAAQAITEITVPPEFDVKVFATPPVFNSPTSITATPDG